MSRHHAQSSRRRFTTTFVVLVVILAVIAPTLALASLADTGADATGAASSSAKPPFRCFRPFKALDGFSPKFMHRGDNCAFDFMRIQDAAATLDCGAGSATVTQTASATNDASDLVKHALPPAAGNGDSGDCKVTLRFTAKVLETPSPLQADEARYTFKLGKGGKQIHYKGFDGKGFSVCCALIEGSGADCEWEESVVNGTTSKRLAMKRCPLHDAPAGSTFTGSITRPLHSYDPGAWNAFLSFHRREVNDDSIVGRLVAGYEVAEVDGEKKSSVQSSTAVAAAPQPGEL